MSTPSPGDDRGQQRAGAVHHEAQREAPLATPAVGQLAAGDHERRHDEQEDGDGDLHAMHRRVQIVADVGDHHVHVRAREAADELGEGERDQNPSQRGGRRRRARGFGAGLTVVPPRAAGAARGWWQKSADVSLGWTWRAFLLCAERRISDGGRSGVAGWAPVGQQRSRDPNLPAPGPRPGRRALARRAPFTRSSAPLQRAPPRSASSWLGGAASGTMGVMTSLPDRPNTALLVVDVQRGVVANAHDRDGVIANINTLVDRARHPTHP